MFVFIKLIKVRGDIAIKTGQIVVDRAILAVGELKNTMIDLAVQTGMIHPAISLSVKRGEKIVRKEERNIVLQLK